MPSNFYSGDPPPPPPPQQQQPQQQQQYLKNQMDATTDRPRGPITFLLNRKSTQRNARQLNAGPASSAVRIPAMPQPCGEFAVSGPPRSAYKRQKTRTTPQQRVKALPLSREPIADDEPLPHDPDTINTWIYPTNYPKREYQFRIAESALLHNTLVVLPTGLGKTFIAAVVMYNYYRWFPTGKIAFLAPTRPLVGQQIEACTRVMGISPGHMVELTGQSKGPTARAALWGERRVFFLTPHILCNDIKTGICPAAAIVCLVVDEAHKAQGRYQYVQVVQALASRTKYFRILALSASPGVDTKSIQNVITNLLINNIEVRTDEDPDVSPYIHEKQVELVSVPLGEQITHVKTSFEVIMRDPVNALVNAHAYYERNLERGSKFKLISARDVWRARPEAAADRANAGAIETNFSIAITLYHAYALLMSHGLEPFLSCIHSLMDDPNNNRGKKELFSSAAWRKMLDTAESRYSATSAGNHPKLEKLEQIVVQHFTGDAQRDSRVMVFTQYRDSVREIANLLDKHQPQIKVMPFIGQSAGKGSAGITQKEQLQIISTFRKGGYNCLVSTSIGEEGLDIGEVDLIICFDAHLSPTRLIQRMGRTGRKRDGRVVMLVTDGAEKATYLRSQQKGKAIYANLLKSSRSSLVMCPNIPRMVPDGVSPVVEERMMSPSESFPLAQPNVAAVGDDADSNNDAADALQRKRRKKSAATSAAGNELLTAEQWQFLQSEYADLSTNDYGMPTVPPLAVAAFPSWQSIVSPFARVTHSRASKLLTDTVQFLQQRDADNIVYHTQMTAVYEETQRKRSLSNLDEVDHVAGIRSGSSSEDDAPKLVKGQPPPLPPQPATTLDASFDPWDVGGVIDLPTAPQPNASPDKPKAVGPASTGSILAAPDDSSVHLLTVATPSPRQKPPACEGARDCTVDDWSWWNNTQKTRTGGAANASDDEAIPPPPSQFVRQQEQAKKKELPPPAPPVQLLPLPQRSPVKDGPNGGESKAKVDTPSPAGLFKGGETPFTKRTHKRLRKRHSATPMKPNVSAGAAGSVTSSPDERAVSSGSDVNSSPSYLDLEVEVSEDGAGVSSDEDESGVDKPTKADEKFVEDATIAHTDAMDEVYVHSLMSQELPNDFARPGTARRPAKLQGVIDKYSALLNLKERERKYRSQPSELEEAPAAAATATLHQGVVSAPPGMPSDNDGVQRLKNLPKDTALQLPPPVVTLPWRSERTDLEKRDTLPAPLLSEQEHRKGDLSIKTLPSVDQDDHLFDDEALTTFAITAPNFATVPSVAPQTITIVASPEESQVQAEHNVVVRLRDSAVVPVFVLECDCTAGASFLFGSISSPGCIVRCCKSALVREGIADLRERLTALTARYPVVHLILENDFSPTGCGPDVDEAMEELSCLGGVVLLLSSSCDETAQLVAGMAKLAPPMISGSDPPQPGCLCVVDKLFLADNREHLAALQCSPGVSFHAALRLVGAAGVDPRRLYKGCIAESQATQISAATQVNEDIVRAALSYFAQHPGQ
eukprot:TRINITY_DN2030_c0_g1_i4.p1 TRINITY_DN2030_c0_g1~~TRINITY_DN2030_c0_g1_i4.p1  ORF type:complete len:1533 (-),score=304.73 TRINITY_DN2030_c0_g1_i4:3616-8145(-)